jgi:hypothetical protein
MYSDRSSAVLGRNVGKCLLDYMAIVLDHHCEKVKSSKEIAAENHYSETLLHRK